jgi:hypothetical protein
MPLLQGTRVINPSGDVVIYDPVSKLSLSIPAGTEYRHISLGKKADRYTVYFPFQNGYYSARLHSTMSDTLVRAGVTLLAPMASLDRSAPVVNLPGSVRVPLSQVSIQPLTDIITDMSPYTLTIDPDITLDSDKNGIYEDDFASSAPSMSVTKDTLTVGPYDTLGTRMMNMEVRDLYGNMTIAPLEIEVYAPIPQIQNVTSTGVLMGLIEPRIDLQKVDIFRARERDGIDRLSIPTATTDNEGLYSMRGLFGSSGVVFTSSDSTIRLSPGSGLPVDTMGLSIDFSPATVANSMQLRISRADKTKLFSVDIIPPTDITLVE